MNDRSINPNLEAGKVCLEAADEWIRNQPAGHIDVDENRVGFVQRMPHQCLFVSRKQYNELGFFISVSFRPNLVGGVPDVPHFKIVQQHIRLEKIALST